MKFGKAEAAEDILNRWGRNIDRVLDIVTKMTQDISKEAMQRQQASTSAA